MGGEEGLCSFQVTVGREIAVWGASEGDSGHLGVTWENLGEHLGSTWGDTLFSRACIALDPVEWMCWKYHSDSLFSLQLL